MSKLKEWQTSQQRENASKYGRNFAFFCPGCYCSHAFTVGGTEHPRWEWNGSLDSPTFSPSLFYTQIVCHSFVRDGRIQFLGDCTHKLAGKTVDIPEWED